MYIIFHNYTHNYLGTKILNASCALMFRADSMIWLCMYSCEARTPGVLALSDIRALNR